MSSRSTSAATRDRPALAFAVALAYLVVAVPAAADTLEQRFPAPEGCVRVPLESGSYGEYLRRFPLKLKGSEVHDFTGAVVDWGAELGAVLDVDLITTDRWKDLQQ